MLQCFVCNERSTMLHVMKSQLLISCAFTYIKDSMDWIGGRFLKETLLHTLFICSFSLFICSLVLFFTVNIWTEEIFNVPISQTLVKSWRICLEQSTQMWTLCSSQLSFLCFLQKRILYLQIYASNHVSPPQCQIQRRTVSSIF
jgi:hypothetical protein